MLSSLLLQPVYKKCDCIMHQMPFFALVMCLVAPSCAQLLRCGPREHIDDCGAFMNWLTCATPQTTVGVSKDLWTASGMCHTGYVRNGQSEWDALNRKSLVSSGHCPTRHVGNAPHPVQQTDHRWRHWIVWLIIKVMSICLRHWLAAAAWKPHSLQHITRVISFTLLCLIIFKIVS